MPTFKEFVPLVPVDVGFKIKEGTWILFNSRYEQIYSASGNRLLGRRNEPVVASREICEELIEFNKNSENAQ